MKHRRTLRRSLAAAALLCGALIMGAVLVKRELYTSYAEQRLISAAGGAGVSLGFGKSELFSIGLRASNANITFLAGNLPITLSIPELTLRPRLLNWMIMQPRIVLQAAAYGGQTMLDLRFGWDGRSGAAAVKCEKLSLAAHPQLQSLGVRKGTLEVNIPEVRREGAVLSASGEIKINGMNIPNKSTWKIPLGDAAQEENSLPLTIPPIADMNLSLKAGLSGDELKVEHFAGSSSLGKWSCAGSVTLNPKTRRRVLALAGSVALSPEGVKELGTYMQILSRGKLTATTANFEVDIKGDAASPQLVFSAK
jgi:hypothetical protein